MFDPGNFTIHYVENLCGSLADLGAQVELITSPALFEQTGPSSRYPAHHLFFRQAARQFFRRRAALRQALKGLSYPAGLWRTWQALQARTPGIFHAQWALVPQLDTRLFRAIRAKGWRVVYTAHELIYDLERPARRRRLRSMLREIDAVIVHTPGLAQRLREDSGDVVREIREIPEGIATLPQSPEMDRVRTREMLGLESSAPLLLFFGLIKPYKGLEYLLRAWPLVRHQFPTARLLIAGEPMMPFAPLQQLMDGLGGSVVARLGYVARPDVQSLFCAADAVVLPYLASSTSAVVPLAYQYGRPMIATAVGGMPEIVQEAKTGLLVPPRSEQALAAAICRGLREPSMLARMGALGREWFEKERSWAQSARRTLELYQSLVK